MNNVPVAKPKVVWHPMPSEVRDRINALKRALQCMKGEENKKMPMANTDSIQNGRGLHNGEDTPYPHNGQQSGYRGKSSQSESTQHIGLTPPRKRDSTVDCRIENGKDLLSYPNHNRSSSDRSNPDQNRKNKNVDQNIPNGGHVRQVSDSYSLGQQDNLDCRSVSEYQFYPGWQNSSELNDSDMMHLNDSGIKNNSSWRSQSNGKRSLLFRRGSTEEGSEQPKTKHTIRFRGFGWKNILKRKRCILESALKKDISNVSGFPENDILHLNLAFNKALIVTFFLQHKSGTELKEIHTIMRGHNFPNTSALYDEK
ncbi:hypothetical protein LSM04_006764 [Trypanosoma melophagium]|uniref:uncharacterized protein n=1 Tax=Trypanosoma melophagium TaxID=715481 RepID=UPI00351A3F0B|nr:hypothetical protein LSM04_006764 [Trypanosoma melophagium]